MMYYTIIIQFFYANEKRVIFNFFFTYIKIF